MKKKIFSILLLLLFSFAIVACTPDGNGNGDGNGDVVEDKIAPLLDVVPENVTIEFNQDYDLMTGVTARDNVDGTITDKVVVDEGDFDNQVPGTYTITYTVKDAAGNETTKTRTITVAELRTTLEIDGEQFPILYNPHLNEYNENSFPFDLTKVSVIEKAYADWLAENNAQRFGAFWSVVVTLDADKKVVEYRDYDTNNVDANGSTIATHWSTGTGTGQNNDYVNRGGMLANLNIPEGGYVVVFINDGVNGEGSPRFFGAEHVVADAFEAIGKQFVFHNVPETDHFDPAKTYPIIKLEEESVDSRLIPIVTLDQGTKATEAFGENLLGGVSVFHDREELTAKVVEVAKIVEEERTVIEAKDIDENDLAATYEILYEVTDALGNVGTETRIFRYVKSVEPVENDKVRISGREFDLKYNFNFDDQIGFEPTVYRLSKEHLESLEGFDTLADGGAALTPKKWYNIPWALLAVTDAEGHVLALRIHQDGRQLTWDEEAGAIKEELNVFPANQLQLGILDLVPEGGYVFTFQHTSFDNSPRTFGFQTLVNTESGTDGGFSQVAYMDVAPFAEDFKIEVVPADGTVEDKEYLTFNGKASIEFEKGYNFEENIGTTHKVYQFTYEQWQAISAIVDHVDYDTAGSTHKMANLSLFVTDAEGNVVVVRLYQGWTADESGIQLTKDETGAMVVQMSGAFNRNNVEIGLMDLIPEGGFVYVLATPTPGSDEGFSTAMKFGYQHLLGLQPSLVDTAKLNGEKFVDFANAPINPFAEGYKVVVTEEFLNQ